ncbi:chemotaxis protein [Streptomyces sp. NPDC048330]|uniref:baeRF3 domain-containing protein n=1 Tax=Streptomyces sp. NPDC048330 TaxID=3365533 RepID=UPI003710B586
MKTDAVTADTLRDLRTTRPYPVVTLSMPTHRREPDNAQDGVRLRNSSATLRSASDPKISRAHRTALLQQLQRAATDLTLHLSDDALHGLVVFVSTAEYQVWHLHRQVPYRVVLSDTYVTRNLVAAKAQAHPYWVLAIAADRATLWHGSGGTLREHEGDGFPSTSQGLDWDVQHKERVGDQDSVFSGQDTRQFLRTVDTSLAAVLAADPCPLFLLGLPEAVTMFQEVGTTPAPDGVALKGGLRWCPRARCPGRSRPDTCRRSSPRVRRGRGGARRRSQPQAIRRGPGRSLGGG